MHNQYKKLLSFLENQEHKSKNSVKKRTIQKPKYDKQISLGSIKRADIKEFDIYSYIPPTEQYNNSKGFDVKKFESLMRSKLINNHVKSQKYKRPYISVSELYSCLRQVFYKRSNYSVDLDQEYRFSYLYMIQKIGDNIHDIIQNLYDFTENEKTIISEYYKVKGRIDALRENFLYEIKSIDVEKFKNEYIKEHFYQANIYAYILNNEYNYNIDTVVLIYALRNLKKIIPFDIPVDNELAKSYLERASILLSSLSQKTSPDPIGATAESCQYCLYKKYCIEEQCVKTFQPFQKQHKTNNKEKPIFLL